MTPHRKRLASGQWLSFDGTECRRIFPAGWRENFFWIFGHKKGANLRFMGACALLGACFSRVV